MRHYFDEDILDSYRELARDLEDLKNDIADIKVSSVEEFQQRAELLEKFTEDIASVKGFIAKRLEKEVF